MKTSPRNRIAGMLDAPDATNRSLGNGLILVSTRRRDDDDNTTPPIPADEPSEFGEHLYGVALVDQSGEDVAMLIYGDTVTAQPDGALVVARRDGKPNVMVAPGVWRCLFTMTPDAKAPIAVAACRPL